MTHNHRTARGLAEAERPTTTNPYGLPLAPVRVERPSAPCDLGDYGAEELRGWLVIFSRDVDFAVYRRAREVFQAAKDAADAAQETQEAAQADGGDSDAAAAAQAQQATARGEAGLRVMDDVVGWLEQILLGWNFVDSHGQPLPQPRDGGAVFCPLSALPAISRAFGKASQPPKA